MAGAATRDRGGRAGTRGDCAEEAGPARPAVGAGLPWRADAGHSVRPGGEAGAGAGGGPRRGSAQGVALAAHGRCSTEAGGSGPRREQESSLRPAGTSGSSALGTVGGAVSPERRRHSGRDRQALPLRGRRLRALANGTRAPGPSSRFRAPTPLPRPFSHSPSCPHPARTWLPGSERCSLCPGRNPLPCCAPGSG